MTWATGETMPVLERKRRRAPQQRSLDTRSAIIKAAIIEFGAYGFAGATTRKIAADAGVLNSLLHYHFPEKEDLWIACVDELYRDFSAELLKIFQQTEPGVEQLRAVFRLHLHTSIENPSWARFSQYDLQLGVKRKNYIAKNYLHGLFDRLAKSAEIAQAQGAFPSGDPRLIIPFIIGAIVYVGTRQLDIELVIGRPFDSDLIQSFSDLIETLMFLPRSNPGAVG